MSENVELLLETSRFRVVEHILSTGEGKNSLRRQVIEHPGSVAIIPLLEGDRVCLIRNFRIAVEKTLIELPAGTIDPPESPANTAERELQEETGYLAERWLGLPGFYLSPGILHERMHLFVADHLTAGPTARESGEEIENLIVPWDDAVAMVLSGEIEDAKTVVGILLWDRLRKG
ncbi:NUDIX hydrolase [Bythopirellula polymerisocia]|uniref:GDP-mannose pyrophosphatase n=1 Tax=Bythopirellula polymerisocia TaxID=2528003 RepID=A0A5C6CYE5_9BACT|nr:NUDIX hydrolase [Bythopirellula polymerisocia]TWU28567.1 ADP-ribose pyrophosphatase [Bythopirellula polymerisocia]